MLRMRNGVDPMSKRKPRYVKPYDNLEKHMPGMNWCGPGTNVWRRLRENVEPIDELDAACKAHDLVTETRGPYHSKGDARRLRAADKKLLKVASRLAMPWNSYQPKWRAIAVQMGMEYVLRTGDRGRRIK